MENYEKCAEYTKTHDWESICRLNNIEFDSFLIKKELKSLPNYLNPDEVVFILTSGTIEQTKNSNFFDFGTDTTNWLIVLTSDRFIFLCAALLTSSVNTQSIRHDRVQAISASQGWFFGKLIMDLGNRTLAIEISDKKTVKVIADLVNKWLKELSSKSNAPVPAQTSQSSSESPSDKLNKLVDLHTIGAISDEEFNAAKQRILSSSESPLDKLKKLVELNAMGALSEDEFNAAKQRILSSL